MTLPGYTHSELVRAARAVVGTVAAVSLWLALGASPTRAQTLPESNDYNTPRGLALGSGARASSMSTSALALNPGAIGMASLYHLEGVSEYRPSGGGWWLGAAAVDSITNRVAAGMSFRGVFDQGEADYGGFDGRLALAMPLGDALSVGVAGRYLRLRPDGQDEVPADAANQGVKGFTLDASIAVKPVEWLRIAALGYNLIDRSSSLAPVTVGGSAAVMFGSSFSVGGEGLVDLTTFEQAEVIAGGGAEFLAGGSVPLRAGYRWDSGRQRHSVTAGIGYVDKQVGVDLSLRQDVTDEKGTRLMFGLRYHVH